MLSVPCSVIHHCITDTDLLGLGRGWEGGTLERGGYDLNLLYNPVGECCWWLRWLSMTNLGWFRTV